MDPVAYAEYTERLVVSLAADERVVGVVAFGSTAATEREPDRWSDHDLGVVVVPGAEEEFRSDPSWLPDHGRLLLWMRETETLAKGVYDDGHLVEATVVPPDGFGEAPIGAYRVLLDKGGIGTALPGLRAATVARVEAGRRSEGYLVGQFVTGLLVGLQRYGRGEVLSGHESVKIHAAGHLLALLSVVLEPTAPGIVDDLNPWRRVEQAFPEAAARISEALTADLPETVLGLLAAAETTVMPRVAEWPAGVAAVVRRMATGLMDGSP